MTSYTAALAALAVKEIGRAKSVPGSYCGDRRLLR
jgi:hypothetical protein